MISARYSMGTTSAHAENTLQTPHTPIFGGTTSAHAENTRANHER